MEPQGRFVSGRHILENIIVIQGAIHTNLGIKQQGMAIKLEMANAFDRVNDFFLFEIMLNLGFSKEFIRWVKTCITNHGFPH